MHELLRELVRRHTPTVLLVTHDVDEAITLAERVLVLDEGRISVDLPVDLSGRRDPSLPEFQRIRRTLLTSLGVAPAAV
jgi:sulfonate transport system ATP-binding protein